MPTPTRFAAIDTSVLLGLAAGDEECQESIDYLARAGFYFLVTETPLQELADICQVDADPEVRELAKSTLGQITNFGFLTPSLSPVQLGVSERVALVLVGMILDGALLNDGLALAEAAYNSCGFFITRRQALFGARTDPLRIALVDYDLFPVVAASPEEIVQYFRARRQTSKQG